MPDKTMQMKQIEVWDPLVRTGHWLLATAVIIAWFVDEPLWLHSWLGYIAIALVLVRIGWGFIGPEYARFANFVRGPRVAFGYFTDLIRFSSKRYLGHSPAGAVMIIALLVMVAVTAVTGMASEEVHETAANITMVLVILHIVGVALASFAHRENLVAAMITGRKRAE